MLSNRELVAVFEQNKQPQTDGTVTVGGTAVVHHSSVEGVWGCPISLHGIRTARTPIRMRSDIAFRCGTMP